MTAILTVRVGRVAFFTHAAQADGQTPVAVRKWLDHEQSMLGAIANTQAVTRPASDWTPGSPSVVWRLLSGNNREIGRGVGVFGSLASARAAAGRAMGDAGVVEAVYVFDRVASHGWCLRLDDEALVVSPLWHRSRRSNRLNLETVRISLGRADINEVATQLGSPHRARVVVGP